MNNSTIRIALSSVLIFLSFKKLYDLLTTVLLWVNVELRIENEPILISINVALGLLSVWFLIMLANQILTKEKVENRNNLSFNWLNSISHCLHGSIEQVIWRIFSKC
jgi:hypothetical protein